MARDTGIARRYAMALFLAARKKEAVDRVWDDLRGPAGRGPRDGKPLPAVPRGAAGADRAQVRRARERRSGRYVHPLVVEFFRLLLRKKRLFELRTIIGEFERLVEAHRGVVRARVTSAIPLDDAELTQLVDALESGMNKKVRVVANVDPAIIGGLVVRIGDRIADQSVRTMLTQLRDQLLAARAS